ncbi:MAG: polyprenyl synthetase family protein [Chloroflexota bacterium]
MTPATAADYLRVRAEQIESELSRLLPAVGGRPAQLPAAMRYAVLGGGKRIRPVFVLACAEALGADVNVALPAACALELVHNYSLVHDDLPAMDNDDTRRGRPTVHRAFGEAEAILAGDALLTLAFEVISSGSRAAGLPSDRVVALTGELAAAAGAAGMCGGQALELESLARDVDLELAREISRLKTGALFRSACRLGAMAGGASEPQLAALTRYGEAIGLAFQVVDDLLDQDQDQARPGLPTFVTLLGRAAARELAEHTAAEARRALLTLGERASILLGFVDLVSARQE